MLYSSGEKSVAFTCKIMYTIVLCHLRLAQHKLNESDISAYEKNHICEKQFNKENKSIFINKWFDLFYKYFIEFYTIIVNSVTTRAFTIDVNYSIIKANAIRVDTTGYYYDTLCKYYIVLFAECNTFIGTQCTIDTMIVLLIVILFLLLQLTINICT